MRASLSFSTIVPRALRTNLVVRLIMPWRLPCADALTLPVPVILNRFLAPLLVFNLGILLSSIGPRATPGPGPGSAAGLKHEKPPRHAPPGGLRCSHTAIGQGAQRLSARARGPRRSKPAPARRSVSPPETPRLARGQHHHHLTAFHARLGFDLGVRLRIRLDPLQDLPTE